MDAGVTSSSARSILEKPLSQLTEEDISQLTRDDCRKFLTQKGMRRPSWNKSQAIQQVISLKALLESGDDSGAGVLRKGQVARPPPPPAQNVECATSNSADSGKELAFVDESGPYQGKDPQKAPPSGEISCRLSDKDNRNVSPRSPCETNEMDGQMTIFYCGKVNVYDEVPLDKARAIMHLAASPIDLFQENAVYGNLALRSITCHLQPTSDKNGLVPSTPLSSHPLHAERMTEHLQQLREKENTNRDPDVDGQASRKVSLQRYLEKRKDRGRFFKCKKNTGQTSSSLEIYLNQSVRMQNSNGHLTRSSPSSLPQQGVTHAFCGSADDSAKVANLSVDLNDESIQEC